MAISCTTSTPHFSSGCALLKHYDANNDGIISSVDATKAAQDYFDGIITKEEAAFIATCYNAGGSINLKCPGCYVVKVNVTTVANINAKLYIDGVSMGLLT